MRKIIQTIKLGKYKTKIVEETLKKYPNEEYLVLYKDGTTKITLFKSDLIEALQKDHIKPIRYIFDMTDRICIDRDIKINIDKLEEGE